MWIRLGSWQKMKTNGHGKEECQHQSCEVSQLRYDICDELLDETTSLAPAVIAVGKGGASRNCERLLLADMLGNGKNLLTEEFMLRPVITTTYQCHRLD